MQQSNNPAPQPALQSVPPASETSLRTEETVAQRQLTPVMPESPLHRQVEPWAEPVDGEQLLDDIFATIKRYVIAEDATLRAATLWAVHTWLMDVWTVSPIANITAPEMRCGKTLFLQVLEELAYRPMTTSNITPAAMFRAINEWYPTLLIDEVDSFLKGNDDVRGMLNSGLYKKNAFVMRCVGDDHSPKQFSVWCAKALCGIGSLASTLADRSIVLRLRRKLPSESTENLRRSNPELWSALRSRIVRWTSDQRNALFTHVPEPVLGIHERANDCWEPLISIAETAGTRWAEYAKSAAVALQEGEDDAPSAGVELLQSVRRAFDRNGSAKMYSTALLQSLTTLEARWSRWNQGRPLSPHQLARMLREFGIPAKAIRIGDTGGKSGYERSWFNDAFARYLPPDPDAPQTLQQAA